MTKFAILFFSIFLRLFLFCFIYIILEKITLVKHMEKRKISSTNLMIIFFISYSFYTIQILSQHLFYLYSKEAVFLTSIMFTLMPIVAYITCKIINKNKLNNNIKCNFLYKSISSIYLLITLIISLTYITNLIYIYYYPETLFLIILFFLSLPLIYTVIKGDYIFYYLASFLLIITIIFKYVYTKHLPDIDMFTFYNFFKISKNHILPLILLILPLLLEPLLLITSQKDIENKINIKLVLILSIFLSLVGITTNLRQLFEFGTLLDKIRFPYLESIKNIVAGDFFENVDYYYLLSIAFSIYARIGYSIITIKRSFNLNKIVSICLIFAVIIIVYFAEKSMKLYENALESLLLTCSICLIIALLTLPFMIKRRKKANV